MLRIFYAHAKATPDDQIDADVRYLIERTRAKMGPTTSVVSGRDHWRDFSAVQRGWNGWIPKWSTGVDLAGEPNFHWIIVPDAEGTPRCGKATGQGVAQALLGNKPVIYWNRLEGTFQAVERIEHTDPKDYQTGWTLYPKNTP